MIRYAGISTPWGIMFFSPTHRAFVNKRSITVQKNNIRRYYILATLVLIDVATIIWSYFTTGTASTSGVANTINSATVNVSGFYFVLLDIAIWGFYIALIIKYGGIVRSYHGAEHKAIHAAEANDLDNAEKYSRIHDRCGTNLMPLFFVVSGLTGFNYIGIPIVISYLLFSRVTIIQQLSVAIGRRLQRITTKEPDEETLRAAVEGMKQLVSSSN